jgi:1,4-alpha-glucan branching enzyme
VRDLWERYDRDLVRAFKQFQDSGNLEIITCGATHGYLPLMQMYPQAVWAQLIVACEHYNEHFGQWPRGIWLPECAYYQGLERMIADAGLRYMITDAHGLLYAKPRPRYGMYAPIFTETGVAVFGRITNPRSRCGRRKWATPGIRFTASSTKT